MRTFFIVALACLVMAGCGYTYKVVLPSGISSVYVPNFKNEIPQSRRYTYESGLEIDVTNAVIDRLIYDGNVRVEKEKDADAILQGSIVGYEQEGVRYTDLEGIEQYRLFIIVDIKLVRKETGEIIWEEKNFTGDTEYFIEGASAMSERAAADQAIEDIAKKIVDRIVEDW